MPQIPPAIPGVKIVKAGDIEPKLIRFRQLAQLANPTANADFIRAIGDDIVKRAHVLSTHHPIDFMTVAVFLLERAADWATQNVPLDQIGGRMPKTLHDLGMLKLAEGSAMAQGKPLTPTELQPVLKGKRHIIH